MSELEPAHVAWSRHMFDTLAQGGTWGVPRSGLIFRKAGSTLVLQDAMPHTDDLPITAAELKTLQDDDFDQIRLHFGAAGIEVVR